MSEYAFGVHYPPSRADDKVHVDIEVYDGVTWLSLNDHFVYELTSRTLEQSAQQLRQHSVSSPMYDGDFITHTTKGNVTEAVEVYVKGSWGDQVSVGDRVQKVIEAFSQPMYNVRVTRGADREIWTCFPAEYAIKRGHIDIHNYRATVSFTVQRLPKIYREVVQ